MAPSVDRNVTLIVSAAGAAAASVASLASRIVDTFGQRANGQGGKQLKDGGANAAMMRNGDWSRVIHIVSARDYCFRNQPATTHDN